MNSKSNLVLILMALMVLSLGGLAPAQTGISVNYLGTVAASEMPPATTAGVVPLANWNNGDGSWTNGIISPIEDVAVDNTGAATTLDYGIYFGTTASVTPETDTTTGDDFLFQGYRYRNNQLTLYGLNVPYQWYDVYVYTGGSTYAVTALQEYTYNTAIQGGQPTNYFGYASLNFPGAHTQHLGTSEPTATTETFVVFRNCWGPYFELDIDATQHGSPDHDGVRANTVGFQIVQVSDPGTGVPAGYWYGMVTSPPADEIYDMGDVMSISAFHVDTEVGRDVVRVDFFVDGILVGSATGAGTYNTTWTCAPLVGAHTLRAEAVDSGGGTTVLGENDFTIRAPNYDLTDGNNGGTASYGDGWSGWAVERAFDDVNNTYIYNGTIPQPNWVQFQLDTPASINGYSLYANYGDYYRPDSWELWASNDALTWTVLDVQNTDPPWPNSFPGLVISLIPTAPWTYYRLANIMTDGSVPLISEIQFLFTPGGYVNWVNPAEDIWTAATEFDLTVAVAGFDDPIASVSIFSGPIFLGTATPNGDGTYTLPWTPSGLGSYELSALAVSTTGVAKFTEDTVNIVVPGIVSPDGTGDGTSWATAMSFTDAITAVNNSNGSLNLLFEEGTYTLTGNIGAVSEDFRFYGSMKDGEMDPTQRAHQVRYEGPTTIFDGGGSYSGFDVPADSMSWGCSVNAMTFQNFTGFVGNFLDGTVRFYDCEFLNNSTAAYTAVINVPDGPTTYLRRCTFENTNTGGGANLFGAIYTVDVSLRVSECFFHNNIGNAVNSGGAITYDGTNAGNLGVSNSVFWANRGVGAGAISLINAGADIGSCTFYANICDTAGFGDAITDIGDDSWINMYGNIYAGGTGPALFSAQNGSNNFYIGTSIFMGASLADGSGNNGWAGGNVTDDNVPYLRDEHWYAGYSNPNHFTSDTLASLFVNAAGGDFRLVAGSNAVNNNACGADAGDSWFNDYNGDYDIMGRSRIGNFAWQDIGAHELEVVDDMYLNPDPMSYATVLEGTSVTMTMQVRQKAGGNGFYKVDSATVSGTGFALEAHNLPRWLAGGDSLDLEISFTPPTLGFRQGYTGTVDVVSAGAPTSPVSGDLLATGATSFFPGSRPDVTIDLAPGQMNPTSSFPIEFAVQFSEGVTGFALDDIVWNGTFTAGFLTAEIIPMGIDGSAYTIQITGVSGAATGTIEPTIADEAALSVAKNLSNASTGTPSVSYSALEPSVTIWSDDGPMTSADTVMYEVAFSSIPLDRDPGTHPDLTFLTDLLSLDGTATGATIDTVEINGSDTFDVTITTGAVDGTLVLVLEDDDTLILEENPSTTLNGTGTGFVYGNTLTLMKTVPTVTMVERGFGASPNTLEPTVIFVVTFNQPVQNVDSGDWAIVSSDPAANVGDLSVVGNAVYMIVNVAGSVGEFGIGLDPAGTVHNMLDVLATVGTPIPNEVYYVGTVATSTRVDWTLYDR